MICSCGIWIFISILLVWCVFLVRLQREALYFCLFSLLCPQVHTVLHTEKGADICICWINRSLAAIIIWDRYSKCLHNIIEHLYCTIIFSDFVISLVSLLGLNLILSWVCFHEISWSLSVYVYPSFLSGFLKSPALSPPPLSLSLFFFFFSTVIF